MTKTSLGVLAEILTGTRKRVDRDRDDRLVAEALSRRASEIEAVDNLSLVRRSSSLSVRDELFQQRLQASLEKIFSTMPVVAQRYQQKKKLKTARILNLLWSDLHFHALLDRREVGVSFGPVEEARRLAALCVQAAEYKRDHRDETELAINLAGDIIQGMLNHDPRDGAPLAEQWSAALHLLVQAVTFLASEFKRVTVRCVSGNHGRNVARHKERATHQKWDSLESMLYFGLRTALAQIKNVSVEIPYAPFYVYPVFDKNIFVTHGDTVLKPGNPSSSIDVMSIRRQINEFNAQRHDRDKVSLFCVGHVHTGALIQLAGDVCFMANGALIPPDAFAQSVGVFDATCGQQMWESVPGRVVGDIRFVKVDAATDSDQSLDKIVRPFGGF